MPKQKEELCAITVFRETWKLLNKVKSLDEAKEKFKQLVAKLILGED